MSDRSIEWSIDWLIDRWFFLSVWAFNLLSCLYSRAIRFYGRLSRACRRSDHLQRWPCWKKNESDWGPRCWRRNGNESGARRWRANCALIENGRPFSCRVATWFAVRSAPRRRMSVRCVVAQSSSARKFSWFEIMAPDTNSNPAPYFVFWSSIFLWFVDENDFTGVFYLLTFPCKYAFSFFHSKKSFLLQQSSFSELKTSRHWMFEEKRDPRTENQNFLCGMKESCRTNCNSNMVSLFLENMFNVRKHGRKELFYISTQRQNWFFMISTRTD